jgi:hypothetical protein
MRFVALVALAGCSFVGVRAPSKSIDPATMRPEQIKCNDSALLPSLDALGGAAAISAMGGGLILQYTTERERYDHFTLYYAGPLLVGAIVYWYSASFGNNRISRCTELKEKAGRVVPVVRPIDKDGQQRDTEEIEIK